MKPKLAKEMTDKELVDTWEKGKKWLNDHMQVTGTNKNELGEVYDYTGFMVGLSRIEEIEDELNVRELAYGKSQKSV